MPAALIQRTPQSNPNPLVIWAWARDCGVFCTSDPDQRAAFQHGPVPEPPSTAPLLASDRSAGCEEEAGGGCGGRFGKRGAESAPGHHWKEGQKLGEGAHQGQSGWSKTTGAMDL
ncbi:hypothetical protein BY996DRAFT_6603101 [Phakopsora pachyrhizi]|uniref:Uncharacterized protein n=1 Tax=Phakopsora pachyrhizi TaxID=170000 RepID=A0AAV0B2Q8_PHAPC|nr:hypothetical protein BY996DRAFT_6603101 [Phakopsora pachyrhizi]CAH7678492.1 hypothetical protein PPACK8108_LOCUS13019 [Phakopsora pachyrhizi]